MSRSFANIIPKTDLEWEQFLLQVADKLKGTTTTLADEEKKSVVLISQTVQNITRLADTFSKQTTNTASIAETARRDRVEAQSREMRNLKAHIARLESRILDIERQL